MSEAVKEISLKPETLEFSAKVKKEIKMDQKTGVGSVDKGFYASTLGDAVPADVAEKFPGIAEHMPAIVEGLQNHNTRFAAGTAHAFSEVAEHTLKKHPELKRATLEVPTIKKDAFEMTYDRARNDDGTTGTAVQHGALRVAHRMYAAESVGELKKVKQLSVASAARAFAE
jgi:hypothetical protein